MAVREMAERWWAALDKPGWRTFAKAMTALAVAMGLALYSAAAAEKAQIWVAGFCALAALALAGWVAATFVPTLARRTPLRWLAYHVDYKLTREGIVYIAGVFFIILAALNTGNNLLFMILASMLAGIIVSGILSSIVLSGIEMKLDLPDHIFAGQPVVAELELRNHKETLPSFSLRVAGSDAGKKKGKEESAQRLEERKAEPKGGEEILSRPVYFPYLPKHRSIPQQVELVFPRRGVYRQDRFSITTKFPFGFLQKSRRVESAMEVVVYPRVEPTEEFYEILPLLSGEIESFYRGRGHDLYTVRDFQSTDSARFVHWKATARSGSLKVREFTREDERRVLLVFDPHVEWARERRDEAVEQFERAVSLCACLAWHFHELDSELQFRTPTFDSPLAPAGEIVYPVLRELAFIEAKPATGRDFLSGLADAGDIFKIILTSQPRGSIPTSLWSSSYFIFIQSL